jgi:hypothetical protein
LTMNLVQRTLHLMLGHHHLEVYQSGKEF